jgi:hypothetical protein
MSGVGQAIFMNQRSFGPPTGQEAFTAAGTFTWVAPAGVTKVSVVTVGGGGGPNFSGASTGGGGGALAYANNISVNSGCSYTVVVGAGGCYYANGGNSSFNSTSARAGGVRLGHAEALAGLF